MALSGVARADSLSRAERMELELLTRQLTESGRSEKTKQEAAVLLLTRTYPQAQTALLEQLKDSNNRGAQIAIAQAIAENEMGDEAFLQPLVSLLKGSEASVRPAAAAALATFKENGAAATLIGIAMDVEEDQPIRLVAIEALHRLLDKNVVDALVRLLDDKSQVVRNTAAETLAKLTNIRHFGTDRKRWKQWWTRNADKPRSEWLADLADNLARSKAKLEKENAMLRSRLARAMDELYSATSADQRDLMLLGLLKDPLDEVRLVGVRILDRKIATNGKISTDLAAEIRAMLDDASPNVRGAVPLLMAALHDDKSEQLLLERLQKEETSLVQVSLISALGQLQSAKALPHIVESLDAKDSALAGASAGALVRIAQGTTLEEATRKKAIDKLVNRYRKSLESTNGHELREEMLLAMGAVGDKRLIPVLKEALKDSAATVRLAAVRGLTELGDADVAEAMVPMFSDEPDRGVRMAAIKAVGKLNGSKYLEAFVRRTDSEAETDATVRKEAWAVIMDQLQQANAETLATVAKALTGRQNAIAERIRIHELLVARLADSDGLKEAAARRALAQTLILGNRPAEAAGHLAKALELYDREDSSLTAPVKQEWIRALLSGGSPAAIEIIADEKEEDIFAAAVSDLQKRLAELEKQQQWAELAMLGNQSLQKLGPRLPKAARESIAAKLVRAKGEVLKADQARISKLLTELTGPDAGARTQATQAIKTMGQRAIHPLLLELRAAVAAEKPDPETEKAILQLLSQVAPKLDGFDASTSRKVKLETIEKWLSDRVGA